VSKEHKGMARKWRSNIENESRNHQPFFKKKKLAGFNKREAKNDVESHTSYSTAENINSPNLKVDI
jgi:hypothetical protein